MKPKIGDIVYIETAGYSDSSWRDVTGGKARIAEVKETGSGYSVVFEKFPTTSYNWYFLEGMQEHLKKEFGEQWASPGLR